MDRPKRVRSNDKVIVMYDSIFNSSIALFIESDGVFYMEFYEYPDGISPRLGFSFVVHSYENSLQVARMNGMTHRSVYNEAFKGCVVQL